MASNSIAVVIGAGPGTGASVARRFATTYPTVLLARNAESLDILVKEINSSGGKAIGISTDVTDEKSVKAAFTKIDQEFNKPAIAAAVFNASGRPNRKPLLEISVEEYQQGLDVSAKGAFIFAQTVIPSLLKHGEDKSAKHPPTLIFTGATASVKSNAHSAGFAGPKFALRSLSFSIAREYAPKGVHVAHAIIDGKIDIPQTKERWAHFSPDEKIDPDAIAEAYWNLHLQSRRCFTNEIDIRPMLEKW